jgi:hypothetical protein
MEASSRRLSERQRVRRPLWRGSRITRGKVPGTRRAHVEARTLLAVRPSLRNLYMYLCRVWRTPHWLWRTAIPDTCALGRGRRGCASFYASGSTRRQPKMARQRGGGTSPTALRSIWPPTVAWYSPTAKRRRQGSTISHSKSSKSSCDGATICGSIR